MPRTMLTDDYWEKLSRLMLYTGRVYNKAEHRSTLEGIFYRMRVGCPWRDIPESFGHWSAIYRRFNLWSKKGIMLELFNTLKKLSDAEWEFIDGSIIKAHQHSMGAVSNGVEAIGKSRGGNTTKVHMAVDSYGLPIEFILTGGEVHDSKAAPDLIASLPDLIASLPDLIASLPDLDYVIADKCYDRKSIREIICNKKAIPFIPRKKNSKTGNSDMD